MLTCLTVLEFENDVKNTFIEMRPGDETRGSGCNLKPGDRLSVWDALHNMLIPSSNVTATIVARTVGEKILRLQRGNRENCEPEQARRCFVDEMNKRAVRIGMFDSHFDNAHGLYSKGQYTTAYDMAVLGMEFLKNPLLSRIWGRSEYELSVGGGNERRVHITSTLSSLLNQETFIWGGKTGTLSGIGFNLVVHATTQQKQHVMAVVMHSASNNSRFEDVKQILASV